MEATRMVQALAELRSQFEKPLSDLEIIRHALNEKIARQRGIEMPPILNNDQRQVFAANVGKVEAFLCSEDGADAVELLVNAFRRFSEVPAEIEDEHS